MAQKGEATGWRSMEQWSIKDTSFPVVVFYISNNLDILTNVETQIYVQLEEENRAQGESIPLQVSYLSSYV